MASEQDASLLERLPVREGAAFGAAAYVVGFIVTYVLVQVDGGLDTDELEAVPGLDISTFDFVGWIFYGAHFANTEVSGLGEADSNNLLSEAATDLPELVYHLIPVVILVGSAYLLLDRVGASSAEEAAKAGATLAAGYLPLAIVGTFLFSASLEAFGEELTIAPEFLTAVLLVGIAYPVIFGAGGALLRFNRNGTGGQEGERQPQEVDGNRR